MFKKLLFLALCACTAIVLPKSNVATESSKNLLITSIKQHNIRAVDKILSKKCVYINQLDENNQTVLDVAIKYSNKKIIRKIAHKGGLVTTQKNANYLHSMFSQRAFNFFIAGWIFTPFLWIGSAVSLNKSAQDYLL